MLDLFQCSAALEREAGKLDVRVNLQLEFCLFIFLEDIIKRQRDNGLVPLTTHTLEL